MDKYSRCACAVCRQLSARASGNSRVMKHAVTLELYSYWNDLRGDRLTPDRSDLDPLAIRKILADVFVLEVDPHGEIRFRIAGARTSALIVNDLKGSRFKDLWLPQSHAALDEMLFSVMSESRPAVAGVKAAPPGRPYLDLEMLLLPLRHLGQNHVRLMGSISPASVPGWLGLVACEPMALGPMRMLHPVHSANSFAKASAASLDSARRAHLTIHDGGRPFS